MISNEKRALFNSYASEFEKNYLLEAAGQRHRAAYGKERTEVLQYWSDIKAAKAAGQDVTATGSDKASSFSERQCTSLILKWGCMLLPRI